MLMEACDLKQYITDIECYGNTNLSKAENISLDDPSAIIWIAAFIWAIQLWMPRQQRMPASLCPCCIYGFGKVEDPEAVIHDLAQLVPLQKHFFETKRGRKRFMTELNEQARLRQILEFCLDKDRNASF